jgi:formate/nitrite transporter FocA (FNT family)
MEKIKDVEVRQAILHDMCDVIFMFIETKKHIKAFKEQERNKFLQILSNMLLVTLGLVVSGLIITSLVCAHKCNMRLFRTCS